MLATYLKLIRPKQWIKNLFVFAPLIFAKDLFEAALFTTTCRAFVTFCLTASVVYIVNDIADVEADRAHPEKRSRPIASGAVTRMNAWFVAAILLAIDGLILAGMDIHFVVILSIYFVLNLAYSFKLKDVVLLDVFIIAAGFMLRVLGGAYAIAVPISSWIVLCSLFISLFLGFAKRRGELVLMNETSGTMKRKVLAKYRIDFLDQMLTITAAGTVISYALYTVAPRTMEVFRTEKLIYTTVFVIYGVFRYLYLIHTTHAAENPTNAVTSDIPILGTGILWILSCILLIYAKGHIFP